VWYADTEHGRHQEPTPGAVGTCPACGGRVRARCGSLVAWHWAHARDRPEPAERSASARSRSENGRSLAPAEGDQPALPPVGERPPVDIEDCDDWTEPDTDWHRGWQSAVPPERREVVIGRRRADLVAANGTVVDLHQGPLPVGQVGPREAHYRRMIWLFDTREPYRAGRLVLRPPTHGDDYVTFRWKHPRTALARCGAPRLLDLGDGLVLHLREIHIDAPCGGWGHLFDRDDVAAWIATGRRPRRLRWPAGAGVGPQPRPGRAPHQE
jgi:competence protein CoiA